MTIDPKYIDLEYTPLPQPFNAKVIETLYITAEGPDIYLPRKAHAEDACFDLYCAEPAALAPGQTLRIPTGLRLQIPGGWEARIRSRSSSILNSLLIHHGTIDSGYRQEIHIVATNLKRKGVVDIALGARIAQLTFAPVWPVRFLHGQVQPTNRGGFGSTGQ